MFDFSIVTNWIHQMLTSVMPEGWAVFIECVAIGVCIILMYALLAIVLIYMERKVCGFFQCRLGPMRVGPWGSIQVICDVLKMLTKEIIRIDHIDKFLFGTVHGDYRLFPHLCMSTDKQGNGSTELQRRRILPVSSFEYRCSGYLARRMGIKQ